jgi:uncharacterized membrane protein
LPKPPSPPWRVPPALPGQAVIDHLRAFEEQLVAAVDRKRAGRDVNRLYAESLTLGQRIADGVAATMGSWPFIIAQSVLLAGWLVLNVTELIWRAWDPIRSSR